MTEFHYRFAGYEIRFHGQSGLRPVSAKPSPSPNDLYDNELAVDVGGVRWDHNSDLAVIDHHFHAANQLPSATAAVLCLAKRIHERFHNKPDVWLVAHVSPDFDAFCAMYLARKIIEGEIPYDQWETLGVCEQPPEDSPSINWFKPDLQSLPDDRRWPVLLAAYASHVDNCRPFNVPRHRALHSVLYAAMVRGRNYLPTGAVEFFDEAVERIKQFSLNPMFDSVLEESKTFAPELAMLDREAPAYQRDIARSRRTIVVPPKYSETFETWFQEKQNSPLLDEHGQITNSQHLAPEGEFGEPVDAVYIRDPECLLFKEWARDDTENSSMGKGFLFTAVAYSQGRPHHLVNQTEYYIALDPERAENRHLYYLWAQLQKEETNAREKTPGFDLHKKPRGGYEGRAGKHHQAAFADPWFDGMNYRCTIVVTPNEGTYIGAPGYLRDLSDDPIAQLVEKNLEWSMYSREEVRGIDIGIQPDLQKAPEFAETFETIVRGQAPPRRDHFRFCAVGLLPQVDPLRGATAWHIGRLLWRTLDPDGGRQAPPRFLEENLHATANYVEVWSRHGVAVAYCPTAAPHVDQMRRLFRRIGRYAREARNLFTRLEQEVERDPQPGYDAQRDPLITEGEELALKVALLEHNLASPEFSILRRFFDSSQLDVVLEQIRKVTTTSSERAHLQTLADVQKHVDWIQVFVVAATAIQTVQILGASFSFTETYYGISAAISGLIGGFIAWLLTRPLRRRLGRLGVAGIIAAVVVLIGVYLGVGKTFFSKQSSTDPPASSAPSEPADQ